MKTKTAALVLGAFSAITLWSRPTIDNFFCDFEWMPEPLYYFLDFSQLNYKILHEDINGFLRISGKEPSSRLALPMEINMFYNPNMYLAFKLRENMNIGLIGLELETEDKRKFFKKIAGNNNSEWQSFKVDFNGMTKIEGKGGDLDEKSILTKIILFIQLPDNAPATVMEMDLDDIEFFAKEPKELFSEANPIFFNWRTGMGEVTLEYSMNKEFPPEETTSIVTKRNFYTPKEFMTPGLWYYRVKSQDGRYLPTVPIRLRESAHRFMTEPVTLETMKGKKRPWLIQKKELTESERQNMLKEFEKLYNTKVPSNPPRFREGDPRFPSFISWYGKVHDGMVLATGQRLQTMAEIYVHTGDESLAPKLLEYALKVCEWNPNDGSGHAAGDIGAYHVQRGLDYTYDALHDKYPQETLKPLKDMIAYRANQVWLDLNPFPRNTNREYNNHSWLSIFGMGEGGLVLLGEEPMALEYVEYSRQLYIGLFLAVQGFQGENGEGISYWSYGGNFLKLYGEMMKNACGIDLFKHAWLGKTILFPIYTCIPNSYAVSFANCSRPNHSVTGPIPSIGNYIEGLAVASNSPYGVWYSNTPAPLNGIAPEIPVKLPQSVLYRYIGWGIVNTALADGLRNVTVALHAGPFASGHQHDDQNAILINAYGDKLLINSGYYDYYGSEHFKRYSITTKAHNTILVDNQDQDGRKEGAGGQFGRFYDDRNFAYMSGEAGNPTVNNGKLSRWNRRVIFIKPEIIISHDLIEASQPVELSYVAHSAYPLFASTPEYYFDIVGEKAELYAKILHPQLKLSTSTGYPVLPVRPRGNNEPLEESTIVKEWHVKGDTTEKVTSEDIVVAMQIRELPATRATRAKMSELKCEGNGIAAQVKLKNGNTIVVLSNRGTDEIKAGGIASNGEITAVEFNSKNELLRILSVNASSVKYNDHTYLASTDRCDFSFPDATEAPADIPGLELLGTTLKGCKQPRATDTIYYYAGTVHTEKEINASLKFNTGDVNVIVDMKPVQKENDVFNIQLNEGDHFIVISATEPINHVDK